MAAFAALALLPVAAPVLPAVSVRVRLSPVRVAAGAAQAAPIDWIVRASPSVTGVPSDSHAVGRTWPALLTVTLLPAVWLAGVIACLVSVLMGLSQVRRVRRDGLPWDEVQAMTNDLARRVGFSRPIDVMVHKAVVGPMTYGVVRPAIMFPLDARDWADADVRRALTHELEHVRRSDWVALCFARVICAAYWFHPLVWIANRQLCVNAERACDDAVLMEDDAFSYADQLVTLAERALVQAQTRRPLVAMAAARSELSTRVHAMLDSRQQRGPVGVGTRIAVGIAAAASLALIAPMRTVATALGQTPSAVRPQFDVASVKRTASNSVMNVRPLPDRLTADATLQVLMQYAYGVQPFQIVGGPGWLTSTRYEIDAKASAPADRDQLFFMMQPLLEDRFHLRTHREIRELPVFDLVSSRGGFELPVPKDGVCVDSTADAALEWPGGRMAFPGELPPAKSRCGSAIVTLDLAGAQMRGGKIAMSELVRMLSLMLGRSVLDRTGFTALFDVQLEFVPDETTPTMPPPPPRSGISGVSIAQALQQQLGLRLEPAKGPVEVIVVDQVEGPSAN